MKRILTLLALLPMLLMSTPTQAQIGNLTQRMEINELEANGERYELFYIEPDGQKLYYLSLGNIGVGNHTVQLNLDPVAEIFVYLGATLEESIATMDSIKTWFADPKGTFHQTPGSLAIIQPSLVPETLQVMTGKTLLTHYLEFSVERSGLVVAANIGKTDFNALLRSLKFYRKLHKKEP